MSLVAIIWSMGASACLTLAGLHALVWFKHRGGWDHLLFVGSALAAATLAGFELTIMRAETAAQYGEILRWAHVPFAVLIISTVWFLRLHLRAGRMWLAWSVCDLRTLAMALTFVFTPNIHFREITSLRQVPFLGELITVPVGVPNPWTLVGHLSMLLLLIFCVDATITVWRRGDRRQALVVGGSAVFFISLTLIHTVLVVWGVIHTPFFGSLAFLGIILAMGVELSGGVLRAAQLARELKSAEIELLESEQRMSLAAEAANLGFWIRDLARDEIWASEKWRGLFGFTNSERLDLDRFMQRLHPDDREPVRQALDKALTDQGRYEMEYRLLLPDGRVRWIGSHGGVESNAVAKPVRMRGVSIDITARKQAEDKFRLAVEASPSGIVMSNGEGRIVLVNAQTEKQFGFARDELIGQAVEMLVPERFRDGHPRYRAGFFAAPQARAMGAGRELFARRKDGTEFPVEIGLSPIRSGEGTLVLTVIVDITARKQAEAELLRQRAELAHVVRVSTMGQLAASLAHELNQPLGAILRNAEAAELLLQKQPPDLEEIRAILGDICRDDQRAGAVIDRARSMLERGALDSTTLAIDDLVGEAVALLRSDAASHRVNLQVELPPERLLLRGDRVQLQQVLLNLILNGMEAMSGCPAEERRLVVRVQQTDDQAVEIAVSDSGHGIQADHSALIFQPFFTTKASGLGMGLPISHSIIKAHGGRMWAESTSGCGATVRVSLPVATEGALP